MICAHGLLVVEGGNFLLIINCTQSIKRVQVGKNVKIVKKSEPLVYFFKNASHVVKKKSNQKHVHVHNMCLTSFTR